MSHELIREYTARQLELTKHAGRLDSKNPSDKDDLTQINSMIESMVFSIKWMATGKQSLTYHGAEKRAVYQKQYIASMHTIPDMT